MRQYEAYHPTEAFHIMLGKLYHKANDTARAIDHFRTAQRCGPGGPNPSCVLPPRSSWWLAFWSRVAPSSLNPHSTIAAKALEAIEAAMNPTETANLDQSDVQ